MGYKIKPTKRIDLGDLGDNQGTPFFIDILNPEMVSYEQQMGAIKFAKYIKGALSNEESEMPNGLNVMEKVDLNTLPDMLREMKAWVKGYIVSWNLLDLQEQPVDIKDDNALDRVPGVVINRLMAAINRKSEDPETKNS